jgi:hypothetical protein
VIAAERPAVKHLTHNQMFGSRQIARSESATGEPRDVHQLVHLNSTFNRRGPVTSQMIVINKWPAEPLDELLRGDPHMQACPPAVSSQIVDALPLVSASTGREPITPVIAE